MRKLVEKCLRALCDHEAAWRERLRCLQVALISRYWTGWFIAAWALSWALCFPWLILLGTIYSAVRAYDSSMARASSLRFRGFGLFWGSQVSVDP